MRALNVDMIQNVIDFHVKFGVIYEGPPRRLPTDLERFREEFMMEEMEEFMSAETDAKRFDACLDLIYVIIGYCYLRGWDIDEGWKRIHKANMQKVLSSNENPSTREYSHATDIVKPPGWIAPDLTDLVNSTINEGVD